MPRRKKIPQEPKLHKATGRGYVVLDGRFIYLGKYGTPECETAFKRTLAEWLSNGHVSSAKPSEQNSGLAVVELCGLYRITFTVSIRFPTLQKLHHRERKVKFKYMIDGKPAELNLELEKK